MQLPCRQGGQIGDKGFKNCILHFFTIFADMRNQKAIVFILFLLFTVVIGCRHDTVVDGRMFRWTPINAAFDSIVTELEYAYIANKPDRQRDSLTHALTADTTAVARVQSLYWQARLERSLDNHPRAGKFTDSAMTMIDSAAYPYEWSRLIQLKASMNGVTAREAYALSSRNLEYYEQTGDSFMLGATLMRLGAVMWSISDTLPAKNYYLRADTVFSRIGIEQYRIRNLVNLANIYDRPATMTRRDSIMEWLLHSPEAQADSQLYHIVLRNAFLNTGQQSYLKRALDFAGSRRADAGSRSAYQGELADFYLGNDYPFDSIATFAREAFAGIDHVSDHYARATIFNSMAFTEYATGNVDAALTFYRDFLDERLKIADEQYSLETTKADYRSGFERASREENMRHARVRTMLTASLAMAIALAIAISTLLYFRIKRAQIHRQYAEIQLQQSRNYLSACALSIDEKTRIIESIVSSVDKMESEGKIGTAQAREITANIRRNLSNNMERETFTKLHKRLHPEFMRRLKADFPDLTESLLKHAAYIAMGMTSKQIAQALNIEYDSVKKSRTRLRRRMNLPPDSSLEDTLRHYASIPPSLS